jgi:hypothetical protein
VSDQPTPLFNAKMQAINHHVLEHVVLLIVNMRPWNCKIVVDFQEKGTGRVKRGRVGSTPSQ